jgi:KTSC domain
MSRGLDIRKAEAALKRAAHKALHGTREERSGRVLSSVLPDVKYDRRSRTLDLRFVTGRTFRYSDIPPEVYERLMSANSKGAFFNTHIRDEYAYRELSVEAQ